MNLLYNGYCYSNILFEKGINYIYQSEIKEYIKTKRIYGKNDGLLKALYNLTLPNTFIVDSIYLGNAYNARDYYNLKKNNIGLIVNCTKDLDNYFEEYDEFRYIKINIYDNNNSYMLPYLDETVDKIHSYVRNNPDKNVLVHCFMGSSRSVTIVIAFLIKYLNFTRRSALSFIKEKRPIVNLNINFFKELKKYENNIIKT